MQIPATIGRYPVTGLIGTGAFSAVYRATDARIGCQVAIKLLADHHSLDPEIRERFIAEARLLRRVNDRHVVRLYELDETERLQPFLVMEYVEGGNLGANRKAGLAEPGATVDREAVGALAAGVAAALDALHAERIVHRDLSPNNLLVRKHEPAHRVLLCADDELVLADLGLSKDLAASSGLTAAAGTTGFAAPEQQSAGVIDERADVYAASALLAWFILGDQPVGDTRRQLLGAGWPAALGDVVATGLSPDPATRPATIGDWHAAVGEALAPPAPPVVTTAAERPRRRLRRVLPAAAIAAAAAGAGGFGLARLADGDGRPTTEVTDLGDGTIRASLTDDGLTAAFHGPAELRVGEPATFTADVEGARAWAWVSGNQIVDGVEALDVTPTATGSLTLGIMARGADGDAVLAETTFRVGLADAQPGSVSR